VAARLEQKGALAEAGGLAYLETLCDGVALEAWRGAVDRVCELAVRRRGFRLLYGALLRVVQSEQPMAKIFGELRQDPLCTGYQDGRMQVRLASEVPEGSVTWDWPGRLARGKLVLFAGNPGLGKSYVSCDLAARYTVGGPFPDGQAGNFPKGDVVFLVSEDGLSDTLRPRLEQAGADCRRVHIVESILLREKERRRSRTVSLTRDLAELERYCESLGERRLLVIDPISSYLGGIDVYRDADVRQALEPLARMAERLDLTVLMIAHLNKRVGTTAIHRVSGSVAFVAAARLAYTFVEDPIAPGRTLCLPSKINLCQRPPGLAFTIGERGIEWSRDAVLDNLDELLNSRAEANLGRLDEATAWLKKRLEEGQWVAMHELQQEASREGISSRTLRRAKAALGTEMQKQETGSGAVWQVRLPRESESELDEILRSIDMLH
jgi:KaiC/GvpD/RAD55 family RecA-like ATPase